MQWNNIRPKEKKKRKHQVIILRPRELKNVFALKYLHMDTVENNVKDIMEAKYVQKTKQTM